jgi:hypothetical protein
MYIHLSWSPLNGTRRDEIESELYGLIDVDLGFCDTYSPWSGSFVSTIETGGSRTNIQDLQRELRKVAKDRYSYVITFSDNDEQMWRSVDQTEPVYARMVGHVT